MLSAVGGGWGWVRIWGGVLWGQTFVLCICDTIMYLECFRFIVDLQAPLLFHISLSCVRSYRCFGLAFACWSCYSSWQLLGTCLFLTKRLRNSPKKTNLLIMTVLAVALSQLQMSLSLNQNGRNSRSRKVSKAIWNLLTCCAWCVAASARTDPYFCFCFFFLFWFLPPRYSRTQTPSLAFPILTLPPPPPTHHRRPVLITPWSQDAILISFIPQIR